MLLQFGWVEVCQSSICLLIGPDIQTWTAPTAQKAMFKSYLLAMRFWMCFGLQSQLVKLFICARMGNGQCAMCNKLRTKYRVQKIFVEWILGEDLHLRFI